MKFDATPDCEDGQPLPESLIIKSTVANPQGPFITGGQDSSVSWSLATLTDKKFPHRQWNHTRWGF